MAMMMIWTAASDRMCVGSHKEEESFKNLVVCPLRRDDPMVMDSLSSLSFSE